VAYCTPLNDSRLQDGGLQASEKLQEDGAPHEPPEDNFLLGRDTVTQHTGAEECDDYLTNQEVTRQGLRNGGPRPIGGQLFCSGPTVL
jgi:hypothetical protein